MRRSLALWSQLVAAASAIPWFGPAQTPPPAPAVPQAPIFTGAPVSPNRHRSNDLNKRDAAPGICGWIEGESQYPYSCTGTSTCFWNTDHHVIACGVPTSAAFQTSCVGYNDLAASCDISCSYNPSINRCPSSIPYCVNITLGGADVDYTAFACGSSAYTSYPEVLLTYSGETTINSLPRYLDDEGDVTYGTQIPTGYTGPTGSSAAASTSSSSSSSSTQTSSSQSSSAASTALTQTPAPLVPSVSPSSSPSAAPASSSSSNTGAIAGGVVGGVAGVAIIAGLAVYFIIRSRRKHREAGLAQNAQLAGQTENKTQYPPGGPQSFPGSPAPAYPQAQGMYGQPGYVVPQQGYPQQGYYGQPQQGMNELPGNAMPMEMQAPQQQFPHQSFHELQS